MNIQLKELYLENFKVVEKDTIKFNDHINIIHGANGQGKTTFMEAILLLLFNYHTRKLSDYIKMGEKEFFLRLKGILYGIPFIMDYTNNGKTSSRVLFYNNDEIHNSDAVAFLDKIMSQKLHLMGTYFSEDTETLIDIKPASARDHLKEIYNINYKKQVDEIDSIIKNLEKTEKKDIEDKVHLLKNKEYYTPEFKDHEITEKEYQNHLILAANLEKQLAEFKVLENKLNDMRKNKLREEQILNQLNKDLSSTEIKISKNDENLSDLESRTFEDIKLEISLLEENFNSLKKIRMKSFDDSLLEEKIKNLSDLKIEYSMIVEKVDKLKSGVCPICDNKLSTSDIDSLLLEKDNLSKSVDNLLLEINSLKEDKKLMEEKREKNKQIDFEKEKIRLQIESKKDMLDMQIKNRDNDIERVKKEKELSLRNKEDINCKINRQEEFIKDLKIKLESLNDFDKDRYEDITSMLTDIKQLIQTYDSIRIFNEDVELKLEKLKEQKEKDKTELEKLYRDLDNIQIKLNNYSQSKVILQKEFPTFVISKLISSIEDKMNHIIESVYNDSEEYQIKIKETRSGIHVTYLDGMDIKSASGWEKQLYAATYSFAINELVGSNILLLDEPDSRSSEINSHKFYDFLLNYLTQSGKQALIISHKKEIIEKLENKNGQAFLIENGKSIEI